MNNNFPSFTGQQRDLLRLHQRQLRRRLQAASGLHLLSRAAAKDLLRLLADGLGAAGARHRHDDQGRRETPDQVRPVLARGRRGPTRCRKLSGPLRGGRELRRRLRGDASQARADRFRNRPSGLPLPVRLVAGLRCSGLRSVHAALPSAGPGKAGRDATREPQSGTAEGEPGSPDRGSLLGRNRPHRNFRDPGHRHPEVRGRREGRHPVNGGSHQISASIFHPDAGPGEIRSIPADNFMELLAELVGYELLM